jgi:hypothetical protein
MSPVNVEPVPVPSAGTRLDPLTGGRYDAEHRMYMAYHGLTRAEADRVMAMTKSYRLRDAVFAGIIEERRLASEQQ